MRTATYLRYSSDLQKETSIDDQLRNVEHYCQRAGWLSPIVFKDEAITGSRNDRPGYLQMLKAAKEGKFDVLVVDDLSRFSRDRLEADKTLAMLNYLQIRVIGVSDGIDTERDSSKIETTFRNLMNEMFLDDLSKKVQRGLSGQALRGYSTGRAPYGYKSVHEGKGWVRHINEEQAQWIRYIFQQFADGKTTRQIAIDLNEKNVPSPTGKTWMYSSFEVAKGVRSVGILGNQTYIGKTFYKKTRVIKDPITGKKTQIPRPESEWIVSDSPHLRIIDEELWNKVQERIEGRKRRPEEVRRKLGRPSTDLFNGMMICGVCGSKMVKKNSKYYGCVTTRLLDKHACSNRIHVRYANLEYRVLESVKKQLLTDAGFAEFEAEANRLLASEKPDTSSIRSRLAKSKKELDNLMAAIIAGIITPTTKQAVETAEAQVAKAEEELKVAENAKPDDVLPFARKVYEDAVKALGSIENVYLAREAMRDLIGTITITPTGHKKELVARIEHQSFSSAVSGMYHLVPQLVHFRRNESMTIELK